MKTETEIRERLETIYKSLREDYSPDIKRDLAYQRTALEWVLK